jgi:spore coat polysaccharide biosynthesis protein SpsF
MRKVVAIIQARMGSTRLPGKVLMDIVGKPMLWHIWNRLTYCKGLDEIIIATSTDKSDDPIEKFCKTNKINIFRGDLEDVLKRFIDTIDDSHGDYVVRITGDTPFPSKNYIDSAIAAIKSFNGDIILCENCGCLFGGQGVYSSNALRKAYTSSQNKLDLEHVGALYFSENLDNLRVVKIYIPKELTLKDCRLTIDTIEDYKFVSRIYKDLYIKNELIDLYMIKEWITNNQNLVNINKKVLMKPYYNKILKIRKNNLKKANVVGEYRIKDLR